MFFFTFPDRLNRGRVHDPPGGAPGDPAGPRDRLGRPGSLRRDGPDGVPDRASSGHGRAAQRDRIGGGHLQGLGVGVPARVAKLRGQ